MRGLLAACSPCVTHVHARAAWWRVLLARLLHLAPRGLNSLRWLDPPERFPQVFRWWVFSDGQLISDGDRLAVHIGMQFQRLVMGADHQISFMQIPPQQKGPSPCKGMHCPHIEIPALISLFTGQIMLHDRPHHSAPPLAHRGRRLDPGQM